MDLELERLVRSAKEGNKEAFAELVRRYQGPVFRQALSMLGDRTEAEDVAQEAFLRAYHSLAHLKSEYAFVSWLSRIVSNLCNESLKKTGREKKAAQLWTDNQLILGNDIDNQVERKELQLNISEALQRLPPEQRKMIALRDVQELSYAEIAAVLNVPVGTVKSRVHTARMSLRRILSER